MKKLHAGYIKFHHIKTSGFWPNKKDWTFDNKPFINPSETLYVGKRIKDYVFKEENLDSDFSWNHKK